MSYTSICTTLYHIPTYVPILYFELSLSGICYGRTIFGTSKVNEHTYICEIIGFLLYPMVAYHYININVY